MEHREEETAACRYISHRTISDSPWAQAELLFQLGSRRFPRVTGDPKVYETLLTSERTTIRQDIFLGREWRIYDRSSFFGAIGCKAK
jgi:hypothetical protein